MIWERRQIYFINDSKLCKKYCNTPKFSKGKFDGTASSAIRWNGFHESAFDEISTYSVKWRSTKCPERCLATLTLLVVFISSMWQKSFRIQASLFVVLTKGGQNHPPLSLLPTPLSWKVCRFLKYGIHWTLLDYTVLYIVNMCRDCQREKVWRKCYFHSSEWLCVCVL